MARTTSYDVMTDIIASTLSSYYSGTWFYKDKRGDLRGRITSLYLSLDHDLLLKHFFQGETAPFEDPSLVSRFSDKNMVEKNLSARTLHGKHLGLSCWDLDNKFRIGLGEENIKNRKKSINSAIRFLGQEDFNYFREEGKKLT